MQSHQLLSAESLVPYRFVFSFSATNLFMIIQSGATTTLITKRPSISVPEGDLNQLTLSRRNKNPEDRNPLPRNNSRPHVARKDVDKHYKREQGNKVS